MGCGALLTIRALFLDVDGVLTDGRLYIDDRGRELKVFDTKDGHGIKMALSEGIRIAWISGRTSEATVVRARDLGVKAVRQGVKDKKAAVDEYLKRWKISREESASCGDDLADFGLFDATGFCTCPCDAVPEVRARVDRVLKSAGGRGAVREFVEDILRRNREAATPSAAPPR